MPGRAARLLSCEGTPCLEIHDRLGRIARQRDGEVEILDAGMTVNLNAGDTLWMGLVPFSVTPEGENAVLARAKASRQADAGQGGDRRWLGRLAHTEAPDPGAQRPDRYEVYPMRLRYTPEHLSRQRTGFEAEDVLQHLVDKGWIILRFDEGVPELAWQTFDQADEPPASDEIEIYRRARFGDLSFLAEALLQRANEGLREGHYLDDPSVLPFAFDWRLAQADGGSGSARPVPVDLWGVRFGTVRQVRNLGRGSRNVKPEVVPRASTARDLVQVLDSRRRLQTTLYLAGDSGSVCLGRHGAEADATALDIHPASGAHLPLGSLAFREDPREGTWSALPDAVCEGCSASFRAIDEGLEVTLTGGCQKPEPVLLSSGESTNLGSFQLRAVRRGDHPWLSATDPETGRRVFADELHFGAGLRPLLGDATALSGVEAALAEPNTLLPGELELTVDGDLQLAAVSIVDELARSELGNAAPGTVTATILDTRNGELLAAVSYPGPKLNRPLPNAWELGSGQAEVLNNAALRRRGAIGSTMKITTAYALVNSGGLTRGAPLEERRGGPGFFEAQANGKGGIVYLDPGGESRPGRKQKPVLRRCSTGPHLLPAGNDGFTQGTFVRRFAASCNNFFVLAGLRHASARPLNVLRQVNGDRPGAGEIWIDARRRERVRMILPDSQPLAERLRDGLAADFADLDNDAPPHSLYGVLLRLGFQPRPNVETGTPSRLAFHHRGQRVVAPLVHDWLAPPKGVNVPALRAGRDFSQLAVPSPARLDETALNHPVEEIYDGVAHQVRRLPEGRADTQYAMLMIGQSGAEASSLGLATLFAPAARADGRAVSPCLFRAGCGEARAGGRVLDTDAGSLINQALRAVISPDGAGTAGTGWGAWRRQGLTGLRERGWGGKTGTYQVEKRRPRDLPESRWQELRQWACGVQGARRPRISAPRLAAELARAESGSARGARACEDSRRPLNPAGIHGYAPVAERRKLDDLAAHLQKTAQSDLQVFHAFAAVALPSRGGWPETPSAAQGLVVAVLVDAETRDEAIAARIGAELAAASERWAALGR